MFGQIRSYVPIFYKPTLTPSNINNVSRRHHKKEKMPYFANLTFFHKNFSPQILPNSISTPSILQALGLFDAKTTISQMHISCVQLAHKNKTNIYTLNPLTCDKYGELVQVIKSALANATLIKWATFDSLLPQFVFF